MIVFRSLSTFLAGSLAFFIAVDAIPSGNEARFRRPKGRNGAVAKQLLAPFAVTGVQNGQILPRLEVQDLHANADQFNIFLLGLQRMQSANQSDYLSYFQIAGIHGRPMANWNDVDGNPNSSSPGYCTHVSNLFLSWHRPYLALYEQLLVSYATEAANGFPAGQQRDRYTAAASSLRLPYWDWAKSPAGGHVLPDFIVQPRINVVTPQGSTSIANPLYSYTFHPIDPGLHFPPFINWPQTLRWPTSVDPDASTQSSTLVSQLDSNQPQMKQRLYTLFTNSDNYMNVSNEAWIASAGPGSYDSFESVHDQIHGLTGGPNYGDMSIIDVSAFDPIFWMHHAMVDRSFAIWQALYPDSYVEPQSQVQSSYWYSQGSVQDVNTPLKPFHSDPSGNFWTSDTVRDHTKFGYTYVEVQGDDQASVRAAVNALYGPPTAPSDGPKKLRRAVADEAEGNSTAPGGYYSAMPAPGGGTEDRLYNLNVRASKNAMASSFFIDFFLDGPATDDPATWPSDDNFLGSQAIIAMISPGNMAAVAVAGVVPLNDVLQYLVGLGRLTDLSVASVMALLKGHLMWRVRLSDGSNVPVEQVPDLKVSVASVGMVVSDRHDEFPTYNGQWDVHTDVTEGKPGGLCSYEDQ